jgi:hypothetical protein
MADGCDRKQSYAIHAADGTRPAVIEDRLAAVAMIRRHDLLQ